MRNVEFTSLTFWGSHVKKTYKFSKLMWQIRKKKCRFFEDDLFRKLPYKFVAKILLSRRHSRLSTIDLKFSHRDIYCANLEVLQNLDLFQILFRLSESRTYWIMSCSIEFFWHQVNKFNLLFMFLMSCTLEKKKKLVRE